MRVLDAGHNFWECQLLVWSHYLVDQLLVGLFWFWSHWSLLGEEKENLGAVFFFFGFGGTAASLGRTKKIWGLSGFRVLSLVFRGLFWFWRHLGLLGKEGKTNLGAVKGEFLESQCHEHLL